MQSERYFWPEWRRDILNWPKGYKVAKAEDCLLHSELLKQAFHSLGQEKPPSKASSQKKLHKTWYTWRFWDRGRNNYPSMSCVLVCRGSLSLHGRRCLQAATLCLSPFSLTVPLPLCLSNMTGVLMWFSQRPPQPSHFNRQTKEKLHSLGTLLVYCLLSTH